MSTNLSGYPRVGDKIITINSKLWLID